MFHTRVRIEDGEFEQFLDAAKRFVVVVEEEPGALRCGCDVDRDTRTVVFVEVFMDLDAFPVHWEFPGIKSIQPEMVPRVAGFERMEVYGHVPQEILDGFTLASKRARGCQTPATCYVKTPSMCGRCASSTVIPRLELTRQTASPHDSISSNRLRT